MVFSAGIVPATVQLDEIHPGTLNITNAANQHHPVIGNFKHCE
jgi:hypothetical protein